MVLAPLSDSGALRSAAEGDPGLFGTIFGGIGKVFSAVTGIGGAPKTTVQVLPGAAGGTPGDPTSGGILGFIQQHPIISTLGSAALGALGGAGATALLRPSFGGRGKRKPSARHLHALQMGRTRAKPRMNWANGHALSRAERRMRSFLHHARRFYRMSHPHHRGTLSLKLARKRKAA
jgi:hypothetical protein